MSTPQHTPPRPPAKLLIQMSGAPGSGKSTVARLLRSHISGVIIDHDVLRSSLLESAIVPFDKAAKQAYLLQWKLAQDLMDQDIDSIIIDSTCNYPEVLQQGTALAAKFRYTYWYVECKVDNVDLLDRRLRARPAMASQRCAVDDAPAAAQRGGFRAGEDPWALFTHWVENPCRPDHDRVVILDSTTAPETLCKHVLEQIRHH